MPRYLPTFIVGCALWASSWQISHAQFTTILNIPPDPDIGDIQSIDSDTQLNLSDGGAIGQDFDAGLSNGNSTNVEVNISGGSVGDHFDARSGSTVNISGGLVGNRFDAHTDSTVNISDGLVGFNFNALDGSTVNISGGSVGSGFDASDGSAVTVSGGEFRLNGALIDGLETVGNALPIDLPNDEFHLSGTLADGTPFTFQSFNFRGDSFAPGTLTLEATALPPIGPAVIIAPSDPVPLGIRNGQKLVVNDGGLVPGNFTAGFGSTVEVTGGQVGSNFEAVGALVTIDSGSVGAGFRASIDSTVNISGGSFGHSFLAANGSKVTITGGSFGSSFTAGGGSEVDISGGRFGTDFEALGTVNISDGSFDLNFDARSGSIVNISGGSITSGDNGAHTGSMVNISGGSVGVFDVFTGGTVNVSGGSASGFGVRGGGTVNVSGGSVGSFSPRSGSTVNISGGSIESDFFTVRDSTVNISDGSISDHFFIARSGSMVNLVGRQFILDGLDITASLTADVPSLLTHRDVTLEGLLADRSPFSFDLNSVDNLGGDFFHLNALLTISLPVPEPASILLGAMAGLVGISFRHRR